METVTQVWNRYVNEFVIFRNVKDALAQIRQCELSAADELGVAERADMCSSQGQAAVIDTEVNCC